MIDRRPYYHDLNAARGVLMILGVFLHSANVFGVHTRWLISDPQQHAIFTYVSGGIHLFRMPAFFIVSGFFCLWSLERYGPASFLTRRAVRIGVPLLFAGAPLGMPQSYFLRRLEGSSDGLSPELVQAVLMSGEWVTHLWFLFVLLGYFLLAAVLASTGRPWQAAWHLIDRSIARLPGWVIDRGPLLLALPLLSLAMLALLDTFPTLHLGYGPDLSVAHVLKYAPFFAFGMLLARREDLRAGFLALRWSYLAAAIPVLVARRALAGAVDAVVDAYLQYLVIWALSVFVLQVFHHWCSRPSPIFAWLADGSYTIYLFHHLIVVLLGAVLVTTAIPIGIEYLILVTATIGASATIHHFLVSRSPVLGWMFNGKLR